MNDELNSQGETLPIESLERIGRICREFEDTLKRGEHPRLENFLEKISNPERPRLFRELLGVEIEYRDRSGETLTPAAYHPRFPDYRDMIDRAFAAHLERNRPPSSTDRPERIGPYRILGDLGEGGMGVVYLAEQRDPFQRRVALKLIKLGMDTKEVIARFESERQALAMMDHPNISRVYDAGATEDGRPYFVMEHVAGVPITEHCDRERLNTRERLELLMQVCSAAQHAHQKAIIHRDIKPSNVLVTIQDGEPAPKIIDFGVAKATNQRLTEATVFTELGQIIGTPEYMSPEQAEMTAQHIDTRSDIYSLGVLLYELLVGDLPFDSGELRQAGLAEIQRIIREEEPPRPSTRLSTLGDDSTVAAKKRRTELRVLVRQVRGDLDWITMKALEKDRTRRYTTASEFAADIARHLNHESVIAGPPSAVYRIRKFVVRNRAAVGAVSMLALMVIVGIVASGVLFESREQARLEAWRLEERQVLASSQNLWEADEETRQHAQEVVGRLTARILNGQSTQDEITHLIQSLTRVYIDGRSIQTPESTGTGLCFEPSGRTRVKDLGVLLTPEIYLDGQAVEVETALLAYMGGGFSFVQGRDVLTVDSLGGHIITGTVEATLVRMVGPASTSPANGEDYSESFGKPVTLPLEDFSFVVLARLPENYPYVIVNERLSAQFSSKIKIGPLFLSSFAGRGYQGRLRVLLPSSDLWIPIRIELHGQIGSTQWEGAAYVKVGPGVMNYGPRDEGVVSGVGGGGDGFWYWWLDIGAVDDIEQTASPEEAFSCNVAMSSSRTFALDNPEITEYLQFSFSQSVPVEVVETTDQVFEKRGPR